MTGPKYVLHDFFCLLPRRDVLSESAFNKKRLQCPLSVSLFFLFWVLCYDSYRVFSNFLLFMSAQVLVSAHNPPKITLHGNCQFIMWCLFVYDRPYMSIEMQIIIHIRRNM